MNTRIRTRIWLFPLIIGLITVPLMTETISGRVTDESGRAIPDAHVQIDFYPQIHNKTTRTDRLGEWQFHIPGKRSGCLGHFIYKITASGYREYRDGGEIAGSLPVTLTAMLIPASRLEMNNDFQKGRILLADLHPDQAWESFQKALQAAPDHAPFLLFRARSECLRKNLPEARATLLATLSVPSVADDRALTTAIFEELGDLAQTEGNPLEAEAKYREARERTPADRVILIKMANLAETSHQDTAAQRLFDELKLNLIKVAGDQAATAKSEPAQPVSAILQKAAAYCRKLEQVAYHFICREQILQYPNDLAGSSDYREHLFQYRIQGENQNIEETRMQVAGGKKRVTIIKDDILRSFVSRFSFYIPIDLLAAEKQPFFLYRELGRRVIAGIPFIIIDIRTRTPLPGKRALEGSAWVSEIDGSVLRIDIDPESILGIERRRQGAVETGFDQVIHFDTHWYEVEKSGLRFPTRTHFIELFKRGSLEKKNFEAVYSYDQYTFFQVIIKEVVTH